MEREGREHLERWHAADEARRAKLTPEERAQEDRAREDLEARMAEDAAQRKAEREERDRREREARNDPYSTRGT
jgi:hypothetical protein